MGTQGKIALLALMVGLVAALFVWDRLSSKREAEAPAASPVTAETPAPDPFAGLAPPPDAPAAGETGASGTVALPAGPSASTPASSPSPGSPAEASAASNPFDARPTPGSAPPGGLSPTSAPRVFDGTSRPPAPTSAPSNPFEPSRPADPFGLPERPAVANTYKIQEGDMLWTIAVKHYKDGTKWEAIRDANRDKIGDGQMLKVGTEIVIPEIGASPDGAAAGGAAGAGPGEYRVKSGDSLSSIAKSQLGSEILWEALAKANEDKLAGNPHRLKVGMILRIPSDSELPPLRGGKLPALKEATVPAGLEGRRTYKIKSGDSLWKIAEKELGEGTKWERIYEANRDRIDPSRLKVGDILVLPEDGSPPSTNGRSRETGGRPDSGGETFLPSPSPVPTVTAPPFPPLSPPPADAPR